MVILQHEHFPEFIIAAPLTLKKKNGILNSLNTAIAHMSLYPMIFVNMLNPVFQESAPNSIHSPLFDLHPDPFDKASFGDLVLPIIPQLLRLDFVVLSE